MELWSAVPGRLLRRALAHPLASGLALDGPEAPAVHRLLIQEKPLLRDLYDEWYRMLAAEVGALRPVLEVGSGAGHLRDHVPGLISSDVRPTPAARVVLDAHALPFRDHALGAIVMTNVLHHLPSVSVFFREAARVVRPEGVMTMVEPWVSPWSTWVYQSLHHEPFHPSAKNWESATTGPLSGANGALPWILFARDRSIFEGRHPAWRVERIEAGWPLGYLISGGVSMRSLAPASARGVLRRLDRWLPPAAWAMFALVTLRRRADCQ